MRIIWYMCWFFNDLVKYILFCYRITCIAFRAGFDMVIPVASFNIEITDNYNQERVVLEQTV